MSSLFDDTHPPLPETLLDDLEELLTWDNNSYLTWVRIGEDGGDAGDSRWFTVRLNGGGGDYGLQIEFRIPAWMNARGVAAILPASLEVAGCVPGERAWVDLGRRSWPELAAAAPRVARTCARLINELWGRTESDAVLLMTIEYQDELLEEPFPDPAERGR